MPPSSNANGQWNGRSVRFRRDRLIVSVKQGLPVDATLDSVKIALTSHLGSPPDFLHPKGRPWAIFTFPPRSDAETSIPAIAQTLSQRGDLRYAEPDFEGRGHLVPQDDEYANQKAWVDVVDMESAWDVTQGASEVLIAVLDSGISIKSGSDPDHTELSGSRFIVRHNLDGNAVHHDYAEGGDPATGAIITDDLPTDEHGHGTHVTGIIAAEATIKAGVNDEGIAGINWVSPVYIARVINENNLTYASWIKLAMDDLIAYAHDKGYTRVVVNLSLGVYDDDTGTMREMVEEADTDEFLLICGPGLDSSASSLDYPAAYASAFDHVIAVGVVDGSDIKSPHVDDYSELTLFAPGMSIVSVAPDYKVTLWDPGSGSYDAYPTMSGTSQAAAIVTGIASLMWSANLDLTVKQIRDCLLHTAEPFTDGTFEGLRVHAGSAVTGAAWTITLETPHLTFVDIGEGAQSIRSLRFSILSCTTIRIEVESGSESGLPSSFAIVNSSLSFDPETDGTAATGIDVQYTGSGAGDVAFGSFRVHCVESGESWTVYATANTASDARAAVVLVADKSGSMSQASGIGSLTRMDVLQYSAEILVDSLRQGDAMGVVSFDSDAASVADVSDMTSPSTAAAERTALKNVVAGLSPGGSTSIGDGVLLGTTAVTSASQENKALLVLTDGHENAPEYIADVMSFVTVPVYAIGMGTPSVIQPTSLTSLTTSTGGYVTLTDELDDSARYKVAKYFVQMLAAISGSSLVLDPSGYLRPGARIEIPFEICRQDRNFDVILMIEGSRFLNFELVTPRGRRLVGGEAGGRARLFLGRRSGRFHVQLPLGDEGKADHAGTWRALLSVSKDGYERNAEEHNLFPRPGVHGLPFLLMVRSESGVKMTSRVEATGPAAGSVVNVRAVISDRSKAVDSAAVWAHVRWPDGHETDLPLTPRGRGLYEEAFTATQEGVYECLIRAQGRSGQGDLFSREEMKTAHIWQPDNRTSVDRTRAIEIDLQNRTR